MELRPTRSRLRSGDANVKSGTLPQVLAASLPQATLLPHHTAVPAGLGARTEGDEYSVDGHSLPSGFFC